MQRPAARRGGLGRADVPGLNDAVVIPKPLSDRVNQLINGVHPRRISEQRRHGIADYVRRLIVKCFQPEDKVEAFMFGSVPLRTYLPDGDIDVSIFCEAKGLQDTWCDKLSAVLETEAENPEAEYKVANVSLINAEVKLLKCLVDNIVVDVSFNQIGGLCTLNFLEAMDRKIGGKHLFKRSIILIKAWCYYESRVLGAQHSLLSTYALETMVLYIFNIYHSELETPLEVLYKFLIVFHHFQWDSDCLTLYGPVGLKDLDIHSMSVPSEQGKMLLLPTFMAVMLESYSYTPIIPSNNKGPGYPKYMNIMDPLLNSNNLGRSVSKTSAIRIKNAFGHGARTLHQLFNKDLNEAGAALDAFFKNTWLAQQRPRLSVQQNVHSQPSVYPSSMKPGNAILDLLKDPHKDDNHDRDTLYNLPNFPQVNGSLQGYPPPPPVTPEDKGHTRPSEGIRGLHAAQHMRNLFEMQSMKHDALGSFNLMQPPHFVHSYQAQLYNSVAMKYLPQQGGNRSRSEMGLRRVHSAPIIGEMCPKKKDKNANRRSPPFPVQPRKPPFPVDVDVKSKIKDKDASTKTERPLDAGTTSDGRSREKLPERNRESLRLPQTVVEKLKPIEAKLMNAERRTDHDGERPPVGKDALDPPRDDERMKFVEGTSSRPEPDDHLVVIGAPPEPTLISDYHRLEREFYNQRPMMRRQNQGRGQDYHAPVYVQDMRNPLMQMNGPRPAMNRHIVERPMQPVMEMAPTGELVASYTQYVPCMMNPQFQQPIYGILSAQGEAMPTQMPPHRPNGIPNVRHPNLKMDARSPLVDLLPAGYQQYPWVRPEDRRQNGVAQGWTYPVMHVNGHARPREDVPVRDADDVLSGDIETLTQQLEVARHFIGCKQPMADRSRPRVQEKMNNTPTSSKAAPSSAGPTRPASRERPPRNQLEAPSPFAHHPQMSTAVGFHGNYPQTNVVYQVPGGFVTHPPPPGVITERMATEGDLLAQLHAGMNMNAGYGYQPPMRGGHVAMPMNFSAAQQTVPTPMVDPSMQLPPQPPRSASPARSKDPPVVRSNKPMPSSQPSSADNHPRISLTGDDGQLLQIDVSVYQAVRAAMAGKGAEDPPTGKEKPVAMEGPSSPMRTNEERVRSDDPPMHPSRWQLEEGVVCYKDYPPFIANRLPTGGEYVSGHVPNQMAHLFNLSNAAPSPEIPQQIRPTTTSYGTGSFIPLSSQFANEQRKAREQAEKEAAMTQAPVVEGTAEDGSWSTQSGSNTSEKTDPVNEGRTHPRGRFSSGNGQWSTSTSSNRSCVQTTQRGYPPTDHRSVPNDADNSMALKEYYKAYGEVANAYVSTDAVARLPNHGGGYIAYPTVSNLSVQGYQDLPVANAYHLHSTPRQGHPMPYNQGMPRGRRDVDRWTQLPRDKSDRSPTPDSHTLIRRAADADRWEPKRPSKPPHLFYKQRENEEDARSGLEQFFKMQSHRNPMSVRHHRGNRRHTFRDEDFPTLGSTPTSKRTSPPSSPGTPKGETTKTPTAR